MKKIFFLLSISITAIGNAQTTRPAIPSTRPAVINTVPDAVITDDTTFWAITTVATTGYVNKTPGAYYNNYQSGGGMIVNFKFRKNNRFVFRLYVQANTYGVNNEAWTEVEGTVEFKKDAKGQNVFVTKAEKGVYRTNKNGRADSRPIPEIDLRNQHSSTYLWEKTSFPDDPKNIYLLTVDLKQHPSADINNPKSIEPGWVSKFHIPVKE